MEPEAVGPVFSALADPTRRALVRSLASEPLTTATRLAAELPITRQAVAKHLAALDSAGLVRSERRGRETHYRLRPEPLGEAAAWLEEVGDEWEARLRTLREQVGDGG